MTGISVNGLFVYPIKGAGEVARVEALVGPRGLDGDRRWMLVDPDGVFMTQRSHPRLALAKVEHEGEVWRVHASGAGSVMVPRRASGRPQMTVRVWSDVVEAVRGPDEGSQFFAELLGVRCTLAYMPDQSSRRVDGRFAVDQPVSFADAFPLLLTSEASLADLNRRLDAPIPMNRFRPNLVVTGSPPYAEDAWMVLEIGGAMLRVAKLCSRCVVTTVDQGSGERGAEPLATLASYRLRDGKVLFGVNLLPEPTAAGVLLRVGDGVTVGSGASGSDLASR